MAEDNPPHPQGVAEASQLNIVRDTPGDRLRTMPLTVVLLDA
jgi:hypothetical protein